MPEQIHIWFEPSFMEAFRRYVGQRYGWRRGALSAFVRIAIQEKMQREAAQVEAGTVATTMAVHKPNSAK